MAGITGIAGDGIAQTFFRDTTNSAVIRILVNCAGSSVEGEKVSNTYKVDGVRVELGGQSIVAEPPPLRDELGSGTYVARIPVGSVAGDVAGRAIIDGTHTNVNVMGETNTNTWNPDKAFVAHIAVDGDPPQLSVAVPDQTEEEARLSLTVTASDPGSGLRSITWEIPGYSARPLPVTGSVVVPFDWRDVTKAERGQPCPVEVRVVVRARDNAQPNANEAVREVTLSDKVAPLVQIMAPEDGQKIPNDGSGATIQLQGTAEDHWSGVAAVEYALDDGPPLKLAPQPGGATSISWKTSHRITDYGEHRFAFRATDVAGNVLNLTRRVEIAAPLLIETSGQPLSPTAYLSDLLDFAGRSAAVPRNQAAQITEAAERRLVEVELGRVFYQRPAQIVETGERVGSDRISRVRATIEVLQRVLDPTSQDLAALWTFDEGAGPVILDSSGNGFSARAPLGAAPRWVPGRGGIPSWLLGRVTPTALQFDGALDELVVDEPGALTMRDALSVVAWVKPEGPGAGDYAVIFSKEGEYKLGRSSDGFLAVEFANAYPGWIWLKTDIVLPEGEWCHVAVVYDGGQILCYKNARLSYRFGGSGAIGSAAPAVQEVRIGGTQSADAQFRGVIDELRVYRGALTSSTIARLYGVVPHLLAHWPLDVESIDPAIDAVSKRPLVLDGAGWGDGRNGRALSLASHQRARVDAVDGLQVGTDNGDFTVSAWLRLRGNPEPAKRSVIRKGKSLNQHTFDIHLAPGTNALQVSISTEANESESPPEAIPLEQDRWTHVAYVKDGNFLVLYVDGSEASVRTLSGRTVSNDDPIFVGASLNETGFDGLVEDLRIYGSALTRSEIAELVTSTTVGRRKYLRAAYLTLLSLNGTSFDELRLMRAVEDRDPREKLAGRLGVRLRAGRPDELDDLLHPLDAITEMWLEQTFGLRDNGRDPLTATPKARLVDWRQAALRSAWQVQDDVPSRAEMPVLDPALVRADDVVQSSGLRTLLEDRRRQLQQHRDDIDRARSVAAGPAAGYSAAVTVGLGVPAARLEELRAQRSAGSPIKDELAKLHLTSGEFGRLVVLGDLARQGSTTDLDWAELSAVLTSAYRRSVLDTWRQVERTAIGGRPVTLGPDLFLLRERSFDLEDPELRVLRSEWEERLNSRIEQDLAAEASNAATIIQAEETVLPALRDVLAPAAAKVLGVTDPVDGLSQRLLIDTAASGASPGTTRAMFAVEVVGGLLFALRSRRLSIQHPAAKWTVTSSVGFDADWPWMSSFEAWQAAMLAFFYPENMLYPALRPSTGSAAASGRTPAFDTLLTRLRTREGTQAERVQHALADFTQERKKGEAPVPDDYSPAPNTAAMHRDLNDRLGPPSATPSIGVQEVLYFAPLAVALQLHRWGSYAEALDWFRLVYDDSATPGDRRVYWGLRREENTAPSLSRPVGWLRDLNPHVLAGFHGGNPYTRFTIMAVARCLLEFADAEFTRDTPDSLARARSLYLTAHNLLAADELTQPQAGSRGILPENPVLTFLRLRTRNQLRKLREGRNIAGMKRPEDDPSAIPAGPVFNDAGVPVLPGRARLRPTGHRYAVLVERARRLVSLAGQVESAYLAALEKQDAETYRALEAGQHLALAQQGVQLQQLRMTEAADSQQLASRRQRRVQILQATYGDWLDAGENDWEKATLAAYIAGGTARVAANAFQAAASISQTAVSAAVPTTLIQAAAVEAALGAFTGFTIAGTIASGIATAAETTAQVSSLQATWERRRDEWELQKNLADQDYLISSQEMGLADDHQQIVTQESLIAKLQTDHATAVANYLATKFLNRELYEWMSGVLGDVYAYFLQQATAVALLAHQQLAFERQVVPPNFIKDDYWSAPQSDGGQTNIDRRGITGSVRLLQDIEQLDQYAFENDRRMLNLSQTFSLATLAPFEFEQFRSSGVLPFTTPMRLFDQGFPGHYLRLIRRVRVSVIALVSPTQGIRATLTASGLSRVVVQHESFQPVVIRRDPEQVALTSPASATGVFELDAQPDMLLPFEAMGVDTSWEFQLPKAANPLDYNNIADVLVSIEYTALADPDYRRQVIEGLGRKVSAERSYSIRSDFQDAWYELNNPGQPGQAVTVRFETRRTDFPPNLDHLRIGQVLLYLATTSGTTGPLDINHLHLRPSDAGREDPPLGGPATTTADGLVSTRRANGSGWLSFLGASLCGMWELELNGAIGQLVADQTVTDVLLVVSFVAESPPWPNW